MYLHEKWTICLQVHIYTKSLQSTGWLQEWNVNITMPLLPRVTVWSGGQTDARIVRVVTSCICLLDHLNFKFSQNKSRYIFQHVNLYKLRFQSVFDLLLKRESDINQVKFFWQFNIIEPSQCSQAFVFWSRWYINTDNTCTKRLLQDHLLLTYSRNLAIDIFALYEVKVQLIFLYWYIFVNNIICKTLSLIFITIIFSPASHKSLITNFE